MEVPARAILVFFFLVCLFYRLWIWKMEAGRENNEGERQQLAMKGTERNGRENL